jgi:hypothetical protein
MTRTLPNGVYTAKPDSQCSVEELAQREKANMEIRERFYELFAKSDEAQRQAYHDIMKIRRL